MEADNRSINLLGALAVALEDGVRAEMRTASQHGFTASAALATVAAYPGESLDALARTLKLSAAGTSRLVDRLQADGLIERRASGVDGRQRAVTLTDAGLKQANLVLAARRDAVLRALAPLSTEDRDALERLLEVMLSALTTDRETCDHICRLCDIAACPQDICPVELAALRAEA